MRLRRASSSFSSPTRAAPAATTSGVSGGPQDLVHRLPRTGHADVEDPHAAAGPRQPVGQVLGQEHAVAHVSLADEGFQLAAVSPGSLVVVVGGEQDPAGPQSAGVAQGSHRLRGGGDASLHVRRPRAGEHAVADGRRLEGQVHRVQVSVELQPAPRGAAVETGDHGGRLGPVGFRPLHLEAIRPQPPLQPIRRFTGGSRGAGRGDEVHGGLHQADLVDGRYRRLVILAASHLSLLLTSPPLSPSRELW